MSAPEFSLSRHRSLVGNNLMTSYRYATIIRLYREGARLADLALQFNISHDRVRQIIEQAKRSLRPAGRNLSENTDRTQKFLRFLTLRRSRY